jgi:hypothetical protein
LAILTKRVDFWGVSVGVLAAWYNVINDTKLSHAASYQNLLGFFLHEKAFYICLIGQFSPFPFKGPQILEKDVSLSFAHRDDVSVRQTLLRQELFHPFPILETQT